MEQDIIVFLLFAGALGYLARLLYRSFRPKNGFCAKACGSCGALDFEKLEKQLKKKGEEGVQRSR